MAEATAGKRVPYYDIAKGIGIVLVVLAHSNSGTIINKVINQFHMPLFFLISGLLYSNRKGFADFIKGKVFSLYIPFVFWNGLSILMKMIIQKASLLTIAKSLAGIFLTLTKDGQFFGATWFLAALFQITILYRLLNVVLDLLMKEKNENLKELALLLFFTFGAIIGFIHTFPAMLSRTLILGMFFAIGVIVKKTYKSMEKIDRFPTVVVAVVVFCIIAFFNQIHMGRNEYKYPVLFVLGALSASYATICFSRWIDKLKTMYYIREILIYLGKNSKDVVIWHFVTFRIVITIQLLLKGTQINIHNILQYYPTYIISGGWWIAYLIVGLAVPLLVCGLLRKTKIGKAMMKMHIL